MSEYVFRTKKPIEYCYDCPIRQYLAHIGHVCNLLEKNVEKIKYIDRLPNCPLKEVPPHGQLGDITQFVEDIVNSETLKNEFTPYQLTLLRQLAKNAPTIVEVSEA